MPNSSSQGVIMDLNHKKFKTLGSRASDFILNLYAIKKPIFGLHVASQLTGLKGKPLYKFIDGLSRKNIICSLIQGLYQIIPFELGYADEFMGNPYVVAREIVMFKNEAHGGYYYISHASAMELHQMVTQPQFDVYAMVTDQIKQKINIMGTQFQFVTCKEKDFFGYKKFWVDKSEMIYISDIEKTIIDGLKIPEYCGGITEIAKGLWIKRQQIDYRKLLDYSERLDIGAVYRRLGYLLEVYEIDCAYEIASLQRKLTSTYHLLDPTLTNEGKHNARWRLKLNISDKELLAVIRT